MHIVTIPDELVVPGSVRRIIAPPPGDLAAAEILPVESLIRRGPDGVDALLSMCLDLDEGDLAVLEAGGKVWLTMLGAVVPFNVCVLPDGQVP